MSTSTDPVPRSGRGALAAVPDFFIVGHAKCGTTALYEMLRGHPQIFMPELKEPAYFATDLRRRFQPRASGPLPETLPEYLALFEGAPEGVRVGEASSLYLWSREAARGIAGLSPHASIIAILREPASFLRSLHMQLLQNHIESEKSLRRAIELEPERRAGRKIPRRSVRPKALLYSERVRYVEQLRRYRETFGVERVLVLIYDDFRADNETTVRRVLRFLEVDETVALQTMHANPTVAVRSVPLQSLVRGVRRGEHPLGRAAKRAIVSLTSQRLRNEVLHPLRKRAVYGAPPPADERFMRELRRRFKPEVAALSEYLDRDLVTLWGYDSVE
jgi:hypothetical protein